MRMLLLTSCMKRFLSTLVEAFKLGGESGLDAQEGIYCVAGFLGFGMLLNRNHSQRFSSFVMEILVTQEKGKTHVYHTGVFKLLPTNTGLALVKLLENHRIVLAGQHF